MSEGFWRPAKRIPVVAGVDFTISAGQTLGVVGESGCGKSTLARTLLGLQPAFDGRIELDGVDIARANSRRWREIRRDVQLIFQDPYTSLNPYLSVEELISEGWRIHPGIVDRSRYAEETARLLDMVGLRAHDGPRRPGELSGGQRQRVSIARALALRPRVLVCDEAVSALDVSVQAQILDLLVDVQRQFGISYLFISHDLDVVRYFAHEVLVMYLGTVVESGPSGDVLGNPQHPYTRVLLSAAPSVDDWREAPAEIELHGEVPSPASPPSGCRFRTRCYRAEDRCAREVPALSTDRGTGHPVACHFADGATGTAPPGPITPSGGAR